MKTKGLVYSTDKGRTCPSCGYPSKVCCCSKGKPRQPGDGVVRITRESKGRKGSGVCLITGLSLSDAEIKKIAKELKKKCGAGGAVKNGVIEIQGDHRDALRQTLLKMGYKAKLAGG